MEPVKAMTFRSEHITEGKISIDEDKATPIFPPYAGRVTRLMAKPGDMVEGRPAAVLHRSRRHGAGAERFPRRARRRQPRKVARDDHRDRREAESYALQGQGRGMRDFQQRPPTRPGSGRPARRQIPRSRRRATASPSSVRPMPRSPHSRTARSVRDADLCADVRHRRAAQDRTRPIRQLYRDRHRRPGLHHRRSLDGVARRLCSRKRSAEGSRRAAARLHRARLSEDDVQGQHRTFGVARSEHPPPDGARDDR